MEHAQIERINELARKARVSPLTPEETEERKRLREQYIREFRAGMEQTLKSVLVEHEDGSYRPLEKKE